MYMKKMLAKSVANAISRNKGGKQGVKDLTITKPETGIGKEKAPEISTQAKQQLFDRSAPCNI